MMFILNKIVFMFLNPVAIVLLLLFAALLVLLFCGRTVSTRARVAAILFSCIAFALLCFLSMPASIILIGYPLEKEFPPAPAEEAPSADAIVVLGGGICASPEPMPYCELMSGADRVVHAARLFKAGKAPIVIPSGCDESKASVPLLVELGVPKDAIFTEDDSRNTEENAKFVQNLLRERCGEGAKPKVLLVTSAWHMRRSLLMFQRYAPEIEAIPCATDHECTLAAKRELSIFEKAPSAAALNVSSFIIKEYIGYWGYSLLR